MPEDKEPLSDRAHDAVKGFLGTIDRADALIRSRSGFWERLVLVDGATLALSLTAVSALKGTHVPPHDGGVGFLLASWRCLIGSAGLGFAAQWILTHSQDRLAQASTAGFVLLIAMETDGSSLLPGGDPVTVPEARESLLQSVVAVGRSSKLANLIGATSVVLSLLGFNFLYHYLAANLR